METLGQFLKTERERRGFSIDQVSNATKIGVKVLQAIEEDRFASLPALPFVRGFVQNYSSFLGLQPQAILTRFDGFLLQQVQNRPSRDVGHKGYAFDRPEGEQAKKVLWSIMAGLTVFGGIVYLVLKPSLKHRKKAHQANVGVVEAPVQPVESSVVTPVEPAKTEVKLEAAVPLSVSAPVVATSAPTSSKVENKMEAPKLALVPTEKTEKPTEKVEEKPKAPVPVTPAVVTPAQPTPVAASPAPSVDDSAKDPLQSGLDYSPAEIKYKLVIRTLEDVWVRYRCDEKKAMRFALKKGKILVLRGKSRVYFQASNPDAVTVTNRGKTSSLTATSAGYEFKGSSTLVFPEEAKPTIGDQFPVDGVLPKTPDPAPTAPVSP